MARIPESEVERLNREISPVRVIEGAGLRLVRQGKDLACRYQFREGDDTPSLIVTPGSNLFHCFGCDAGCSVIDWVMRVHKLSFPRLRTAGAGRSNRGVGSGHTAGAAGELAGAAAHRGLGTVNWPQQLWLAVEPVDMRLGIDGLSARV